MISERRAPRDLLDVIHEGLDRTLNNTLPDPPAEIHVDPSSHTSAPERPVQGELFELPYVPKKKLSPRDRIGEERWQLMKKYPIAPPKGYYHQSDATQMVLPGMEQTPHEHAEAAGLEYTAESGAHELWDRSTKSSLRWTGNAGNESFHPGEITSVHSMQLGDAARMHRVARQMAFEHESVSMPSHSIARTSQGVDWSRKEMRKYGEEVW